MTRKNAVLLEQLPISTSSPYLRASIQDVLRLVLEQDIVEVNAELVVTERDVFDICRGGLGGQYRAAQAAKKEAEALIADKIAGNKLPARTEIDALKELISVEAKAAKAAPNVQALAIASGIAEFVELSSAKENRSMHLPLCSDTSKEVYKSLFEHLSLYSYELNNFSEAETAHCIAINSGTSEAELTSHFLNLQKATENYETYMLAKLGDVVVYGSLLGSAEQPTGVDLTLFHESALVPSSKN